MIYELYSIYDHVTQVYHRPFHAINEREAIRIITTEAVKADSLLNTNPDDFTLYQVANFDDYTARYENIEPLLQIAKVSQLLNAVQPKGF